ncbi:MAG TPA: hypothetical protein PJ994_13060, partial [Tepidiformaceae bacterium]|nr:hypothetical protein [Tepidiformaceae bacterium]
MNYRVIEGSANDIAEADALRELIEWPAGGWFILPVLQSGGALPLIRDERGALVAMGLGARFGR